MNLDNIGPVSYEDVLNDLRNSLLSKPVFAEGLRHLHKGAEIRLVIDERHEAALLFDGQKALLEDRPSPKADVEFSLSLDAVQVLTKHPGDDLAEFGIEVVKLILAGEVKVRVCGSVWNVLTKGYVGIIKEAGPDFMRFLAQHGLSSLGKISSLIKSLKTPK